MTVFNIITIFPEIFESYFSESIIKRAQEKRKIEINIHNLRDWTNNKHKTVDDTPYGGGAGMVLKVEPIYKAVQAVRNVQEAESAEKISSSSHFTKGKECKRSDKTIAKNKKSRIILFSAKGKKYNQTDAERLSQYENLILICGRYEGVDERVAEHIADEEISIGDYVLTGGEIPAMVVVDSITRLLPDVLGNPESLMEESYSKTTQNSKLLPYRQAGEIKNFTKEYPQYTKPENFKGWKVPQVLLGGNHKAIKEWKKNHAS